MLNRLRSQEEATSALHAVYDALGVDVDMRDALQKALIALVPIDGMPGLEAAAVSSMLAGVLVGLLIADSTIPVKGLDLPVGP